MVILPRIMMRELKVIQTEICQYCMYSYDISQKYFWVTHEDCCGSDLFHILIKELEYTPEIPKKNLIYLRQIDPYLLEKHQISVHMIQQKV